MGGKVALAIVVVALLAALALFLVRRPTQIAIGQPAATMPGTAPQAAPAPPPPPPPPPPWTPAQLRDLAAAVGEADAEGLRASDYHLDALQQAPSEPRATQTALALAHDFAAGRVNRHKFNWYIDYAGPSDDQLRQQIIAARQQGRLKPWFESLLPTSGQYRALRDALAATPPDDETRRDRIKANMERWRWLPRDFGGGDQLYVNLPTYRLDVVEHGQTTATYKAVIGATDMPTPALSAPVRLVIVNPDWILPQSIIRKMHLHPGSSSKYIFSTRPDGTLRVRQKPGAGNALGKVKIEFPNKLAIYFHDTPSRSLFGADVRTFSHGCVRVQNIDALAASLVGNQARFDAAMASGQTHGFTPAHPWRANIVYFTLVADADGTLTEVGDPYRQDEALAARLEGRLPRTAVISLKPAAPSSAPARSGAPLPSGVSAPSTPADPVPTQEPPPVQPESDHAAPSANDAG